jgi:citronellol/citronellal dehydrogenase
MPERDLAGLTAVISGGSRGIGLEIAKRIAGDGANVTLIAKTAEPHLKLPGTIYTAAQEIEASGGTALPVVGDVRDESHVAAAVQQTVERFGGVDIVVNNASAINLAPIAELEPKRYDLMQDINARGTFVLIRACLEYLRSSEHAHVLTLSPPLTTDPKWLAGHAAYTLSKMGMTMLTLGLAADEADHGIGANTLWPRTIIATARRPEPARRRRGDGPRPHPGDLRRRRLPGPKTRPARVHRQRLPRRRGARRGRDHRPHAVLRARRRAGARPFRRRLARLAR